MRETLFRFQTLDELPKLLLRMDDLRKCDGTRDHDLGLVVDTDGDCFKRIMSEAMPSPKPKLRAPQPGDVVGAMFTAAGFQPIEGCGCAAFKAWMNSIKWWGCFKQRKKIVAWFIVKAKDAGVEVTSARALSLLAVGVKEIRKRKLPK